MSKDKLQIKREKWLVEYTAQKIKDELEVDEIIIGVGSPNGKSI